jgi:hypothetical protein
MEDKKPVMVVQHLYEGKVVDIWVAFQEDNPHNYVLGRTQLEAREQFAAQPVIEILVDGPTGGYRALCHKFKDLAGVGTTKTAAERALIRQINLLSDRLDWREMFFEFLIATGIDFNEMGWHEKEVGAIRRELSRRAVAAKFNAAERFSGAGEPTLPKPEGGYAEAPFGDE